MKNWGLVIFIVFSSKLSAAYVNELSLSNFKTRSVGLDTFFVWTVPPLGSLRSVEVLVSADSLGGYGDLFLKIDDKVQSSQSVDLGGANKKSIFLYNYERRFQKAEVWFLGTLKIERILIDYNEVVLPNTLSKVENVQGFKDHTRVLMNTRREELGQSDPNMKVRAPDEVISQLLGETSHSKGFSANEIIEFLKQDQQTNWSVDANGKPKRITGTSILLPKSRLASQASNEASRVHSNESYPRALNANSPTQSLGESASANERGSGRERVLGENQGQVRACIQSYCVGTRIQESGSRRQGQVIRVETYTKRITVQFDDGEVVTYNL